MSCSKNKCGNCDKRECVCHPCYDVKLGDCNTCEETPVGEIDTCGIPYPEYCEEGCEEVISSDCIIMPDGTTLTETINNIVANCCDTCENGDAGTTIGSITICRS